MQESKPNFQNLADKWPSPFVVRDRIELFGGGMITARYIANLDSAGKGPAGRFRIGRKVAYPVEELIKWLEERSQPIAEKDRDIAKRFNNKKGE
jgi:molybdopterin converting factor small subunit